MTAYYNENSPHAAQWIPRGAKKKIVDAIPVGDLIAGMSSSLIRFPIRAASGILRATPSPETSDELAGRCPERRI